MSLNESYLQALGMSASACQRLQKSLYSCAGPLEIWRDISSWLDPLLPLEAHQLVHRHVFSSWPSAAGPPPLWLPEPRNPSRLRQWMDELGVDDVASFHSWTASNRSSFWLQVVSRLGIRFSRQPQAGLAVSADAAQTSYLPGALLNIAESCFQGPPERTAIRWADEQNPHPRDLTQADLKLEMLAVVAGLQRLGLRMGDRVALAMPMNPSSIAIYLAIAWLGGVVVSIAESFSAAEMAIRLQISQPRLAFIQARFQRGGRVYDLYKRMLEAGVGPSIVCAAAGTDLREGDCHFSHFLGEPLDLPATPCDPHQELNILFSSGTTGQPKAIPWNHATPIKCAMDAAYHLDVRPGDMLAWPTSLGWMMGPWLLFASAINRAGMALFDGPAQGAAFLDFIAEARVTQLGLVPSLLRHWRSSPAWQTLHWPHLRSLASTGECSQGDDASALMARTGYRPLIEYCGGTEIGGAYITGTLEQNAAPACFTTPAFGLDLHILDENGRPAKEGEVFIEPPSLGLSTRLLNGDHDQVYFEDTPRGPAGERYRRHGDELERLGPYFRALGRCDDAMNLGGIKVAAVEIERALVSVHALVEAAAVASTPPGGGPSRLVLHLVTPRRDLPQLQEECQRAIATRLNPLFRVQEIRLVEALPRTSTGKILRRQLR
jgi:acetyl-CoA synthetase